MKLWIDDVRPAPDGYVWCKSVDEAIRYIIQSEKTVDIYMDKGVEAFQNRQYKCRNNCYRNARSWAVDLIDIDHDAGDYANDGGDYIKLLDWLEATGRNYPIHIHSMNPVGVQNMRAIIEKNGWTEV